MRNFVTFRMVMFAFHGQVFEFSDVCVFGGRIALHGSMKTIAGHLTQSRRKGTSGGHHRKHARRICKRHFARHAVGDRAGD